MAAVAGIAYAVLAALEGIDLLGFPDLSASVPAVKRYYSGERSVLVFTAVAAALGLAAYGVFLGGVWSWVRGGEGAKRGRWATVGLLGGVASVVLAAVGLTANFILIVQRDTLAVDDVGNLHDIYLTARIVALVFVAVFLSGIAVAALRAGLLPQRLAVAAWLVAAYAFVMTGAAFSSSHVYQRAVLVAFAAHAVWVLVLSTWLLLPRLTNAEDAPAMVALRLMCAAVALAAGLSGVGLLAFPGSTARFFSWGLSPPALASLIGGFYLASSLVFALALRAGWTAARALAIGIVVLAAPVFVVSLVHRDIFDFGRLQAWLWVILFAAFPLAGATVVVLQRRAAVVPGNVALAPWARLAVGLVALGLGTVSVALLADPTGVSAWWPFSLPALGGRVLGCWFAFGAFLASWSAVRARRSEARLPLIALVAFAAGVLLSGARTFTDLSPAARPVYFGAAVVVLAVSAAALTARRSAEPSR